MIKSTKTRFKVIAAIVLISEILSPLLSSLPANAAVPPFAYAYMRLDRHKAVTATGGTICATTPTSGAGVGTEDHIDVEFPTVPVGITTDFAVNASASNWTVSTSSLPAGATAWPGIGTATSVSGKIVTFPSGALALSTVSPAVTNMYCFNFTSTSTLTTSSAGDSFKAYLRSYNSSNVEIMETEFGLSVVDGTTKYDQYTVTATVPPIFIFYLETNSDSFPTDLDPTFVSQSAGVLFDITTNAKGGWIAWVKDSQQGLYSSTANYKIQSFGSIDGVPTTLTDHDENYVLSAVMDTDALNGCTVAPDPEYDETKGGTLTAPDALKTGGTLSANFQPVATCTGAPPATSNGDKVRLREKASIEGGTPAGTDYSDIITVVAAGNF